MLRGAQRNTLGTRKFQQERTARFCGGAKNAAHSLRQFVAHAVSLRDVASSRADSRTHDTFHFHIEFHPPLRKLRLLKYLAGPEIGGGNFLSDTLPEEKAAELQNVSNVHYKLEND